MTFANQVFWPELHPERMPSDFAAFERLLLAEGDSWFAWAYLALAKESPSLLASLTLPCRFATLNYAYSGDTIGDMARMASGAAFMHEFSHRRYDAVLLSGGGNDLFDALAEGHILKRPEAGDDPHAVESYINRPQLAQLKDYVRRNYEQILSWRTGPLSRNRATPVLLHTYDIPTPRPAPASAFGVIRKGPWLLPALESVLAPPDRHRDIIGAVAGETMDVIRDLDDPVGGIHVVDTCGTLDPASADSSGDDADWVNEIHPNRAGCDKLAARLADRVVALGIA